MKNIYIVLPKTNITYASWWMNEPAMGYNNMNRMAYTIVLPPWRPCCIYGNGGLCNHGNVGIYNKDTSPTNMDIFLPKLYAYITVL